MKKFLFSTVIAMLFLTGAFAQSQLSVGAPPPPPDSGDFVNNISGSLWATGVYTVTNTGADTAHLFLSPGINNYLFQSVTVQADITKVSGTAAGSAVLWGSIDNYGSTFFYPIATYTLTSATSQCFNTKVTGNPYTSYWLILTGAGTEALNVTCSVLLR